nr:chemotaxis response regulator protein-glutamate methylesterase [Desulfobulbaceae bacterium]
MIRRPLRILVVDDTVLYRKVLSETLAQIPDVEVVGTAINGKIALSKIVQLQPDMLTLDFEMPEMDGLEVLRQVRILHPNLKVVMVSAHTKEGAAVTLKALELGALTFITKPDCNNPLESRDALLSQLTPIVQEIAARTLLTQSVSDSDHPPQQIPNDSTIKNRPHTLPSSRIQVVAIGISTGGPNALAEVIPLLPKNLPVPVVIVQHMPTHFTAVLAETLNQKSALNVVEAVDSMPLEFGTVVLAPGGKQMRVVNKSGKPHIEINDDPPENHCQPSADYLFRSISQVYGSAALGVIMTGMGADGTLGLRLMKRKGAQVIAQDEQSCVVFGMPGEAINAGVVDLIVPLNQIANEITKRVRT